MLRCLIVDDSPLFLAAARRLLERQGITVVGEVSTPSQAIALSAQLHPDVTLVDIDLGDASGFEVAGRLHQQVDPLARIILISTHDEDDYADLIALSPAIGFLSKARLSGDAIRAMLSADGGEAASGNSTID